MANHQTLLNVNDFESLIEYLRDELDWDFQAEDIEDLTFDYEPEELGLDEATAAKIDGIKQLRPLTNNQTWGIFYIDFEPKKLPIVALRRILSKLVIKRRTSANQSDRAAWQMNDLLFLSSYGENKTRTISFAHFADNTGFGDLPTLKTITWNNLDTPLHLQHADETLKTKLRFPDDPNDAESWREQWASAFTQRHGEVVRTSQQLARRLAELASDIREKANDILHLENSKGELRKLHKAFQEALIHDLSYDDFADMYAQTISYGLLTAKISRPAGLVADNIADMIPVTNPFLKELLQTFLVVGGRGNLIDFDELGINDVVEMLRKADMEAVLRDFGDKNPNEDPAIHFYELFLKEYDPEKRMKRGVFYTPRPVVSFIVRSVHEILQKEFGLADGLADTTTWGEMKARNKDLEIPKDVKETAPFVQILDPATGTGTFLVEVINTIYETLQAKWQREGKSKAEQTEAWNDYVPKNLLPRLFGFELMMAPYSIAHMKIGLKLTETGYRFLSSERAQIYLTNTLEEAKEIQPYFETMSPALAHEAKAANRVKEKTPITVIVGNPPYSGESMNTGVWIKDLINDYMYVDGNHLNEKGKKNWLQDDYVKFLRTSQFYLSKVKIGVLGFITNHGWLSNPTFRGMRQNFLNLFTSIHLLDLHGNSKRKETPPQNITDENVFDIQQGVAINLCIKNTETTETKKVQQADLWGMREGISISDSKTISAIGKYKWLLDNTISKMVWNEITPKTPLYLFYPQNVDLLDEYNQAVKITEIAPHYGIGIITSKDHFVIDFNDEPLLQRLETFRDLQIDDEWIRKNLNLKDNSMWSLSKARVKFNEKPLDKKLLRNILYRPFDNRRIYYETNVVFNMRFPIMQHMIAGDNLGLITNRQVNGQFEHILCSNNITNDCTISLESKERSYLFPLYLYPTEKEKAFGATERVPNFSDEFIEEFSNKLGLEFVYEGETGADAGQDADTFTPEDVFHYAYAVFHSPTYRARYAEFLKIDFPRLPLTTDRELFRQLCAHGKQLVNLHLLESVAVPPAWKLHQDGAALFQNKTVAAGFPKKELVEVEENGKGKVYINKTTYFDGVPSEVFEFHIGGYQVCHKWLKDRKDRELSEEDINHYGKITVALSETIRLMSEIDETIEEHGGFPLVGSQKSD